ncbi:hypothetical protein LSAT2_001493 [Lamellibrachia satsuma]|nr:hypothetical protein LSAT2_001493 [Lamellibrachia satsuma]
MTRKRFRIHKADCREKCRCPCSKEVKQWCMRKCGGYIIESPKNSSRVKQHLVNTTTVQPMSETAQTVVHNTIILAYIAVIIPTILLCILGLIERLSSTNVKSRGSQFLSMDSDSENDTLMKHRLPTPEPCEVSIESCETYNGDAEPRGSRCDLSVNNAVIVDRIASLSGVTYAMLVADEKVVIGVKDEVTIPAVKEYIHMQTHLHSDDYAFEMESGTREFGLMFDCVSGDAIEMQNGDLKTGALTCFFASKGQKYALSIGHMLGDKDRGEVYMPSHSGSRSTTAVGEWIAQIMCHTPMVIDALVFKVTHPDVNCGNFAQSTGAQRLKLASDINSFVGCKVQKYGHATKLTYGILRASHFSYTIPSMKTSRHHYKVGDKMEGVILVTAEDDVDFMVSGECGAALTTLPDESGTVFLLGAMFGGDWKRVGDKKKNRMYYAYSLPELFKQLHASKLNDIARSLPAGNCKGEPDNGEEPFFDKDIDFLSTEVSCDSGFVQ